MKSIRFTLLIQLLFSTFAINIVFVSTNLFFIYQDIQRQFDSQLAYQAMQLASLFSTQMVLKRVNEMQDNIVSIMDSSQLNQVDTALKNSIKSYHEHSGFQIWNTHGQLLLHSQNRFQEFNAPMKMGYSKANFHHKLWRIFTFHHFHDRYIVRVGQLINLRKEFEHNIFQNLIYMMFVAYPVLAFLIWLALEKAFGILKDITIQVKKRTPLELEPVDLKLIPIEISPLLKELNDLFLRLRENIEREKRFAADAAHELRTPLAALRTQVQVALCAQGAENRDQALNKVLVGVDRATHVVQQLLTLSRILPQSYIKNPVLINLGIIVADTASQLVPESLKKNIDMKLVTSDENAMIFGNATSMSVLVRNLVDNAIRYTPEEGSVIIEVKAFQRSVALNVCDTGPGIPHHLRTRIFERFFRVMGNKTTGTGLGLGIVQQIARLHHAEIRLNTPISGRGLEFSIIFPRVK